MPTLYTTALSANGRKPLAVARQLGIALDVREVDVYRGEGRAPDYLRVNSAGKVPALVDGDFTLTESNAILLYLAEAHAGGVLWASDPRGRAEIARWLFWEASEWQPALSAVLRDCVAHHLLGRAGAAPAVEWREPRAAERLAQLDAVLSARAFVAGPQLSLADFAVAGMTTYFAAAAFPRASYPSLGAWLDRMAVLPAWRETGAELWR